MIELKYKPDFPKVMERFEAWWQCEIIDRPLASIPVKPSRPPKLPAKTHATPRDRWLDVEYFLECFEATKDHAGYICCPSDHFFHGDPANVQAFADACKECRY